MTWAPELWALAVALAALVVAWRARADLAAARAETRKLGDALHRWNNAELIRQKSLMDRWRMVADFARDVSVASGWRIPPPPDFCGRQPGDPPSSPPISGTG